MQQINFKKCCSQMSEQIMSQIISLCISYEPAPTDLHMKSLLNYACIYIKHAHNNYNNYLLNYNQATIMVQEIQPIRVH